MSLPSLQLDDLRWQDLMSAIQARIIANSDGEWTMHGPLDPGMALLEVFSYELEQRLYWLDQVSNPFARALLSVLDESPCTTKAASTVFSVFGPNSTPVPGPVELIPQFSDFSPRDNEKTLFFTLQNALYVYPVKSNENGQAKIELWVNQTERSTLLAAGKSVSLLAQCDNTFEFEIRIGFTRELVVADSGKPFSLFLGLNDINEAHSIQPQWRISESDSPDMTRVRGEGYDQEQSEAAWRNIIDAARDISPPAKLQWYTSQNATDRKQLDPSSVSDGTGGLRRSGVMTFTVPSDWRPIDIKADGTYIYSLWGRCDNNTYSSPPRIQQINVNACICKNEMWVTLDWIQLQDQVAQWIKLPGQFIQLASSSPTPFENKVNLEILEHDGKWHQWRPTDHFYHHGPDERVFVVDRLKKQLHFGNGLTGRIPVLYAETPIDPSVEKIKLAYLAGGGTEGNVGPLIWRANSSPLQAVNVVNAGGGRDTETLDEANVRTATLLNLRERAVTAKDYEDIALSTPGIVLARVHAAMGYHPDFPCQSIPGVITLFTLPPAERPEDFPHGEAVVIAPTTDPGALKTIADRLMERRLLTSEVYVRTAMFARIRLNVHVLGIVADKEDLFKAIHAILFRYLDPLIGGDDHTGWPFGGVIRPSALIKIVQEHIEPGIVIEKIGVALIDKNTDATTFEYHPFEYCYDLTLPTYHLVQLDHVHVNIQAVANTEGGLK